ncbi:MAG TPA: hypothetical protein VFS30_07390 [Dehalococcoidia bacterium]|nr:hypothetical protein [Dehalococcoidia bacterium]
MALEKKSSIILRVSEVTLPVVYGGVAVILSSDLDRPGVRNAPAVASNEDGDSITPGSPRVLNAPTVVITDGDCRAS